ncbi:hypothetical protein H0H81_000414 [Sphagnurus paluster]|uniref:Uncharacterized protein n=1 Tax=Sphagnurus paluster TaxID=117069 RepID=A0A9P7FMX8_9AGAR|nr:hypothetical protein H0H81_000414 [Sphagnurus paluster]
MPHPRISFHALREIQATLRRLQTEDPALSQTHTFHFLAPLLAFTCIFALGVVIPRHPQLKNRAADLVDNGTVAQIAQALSIVVAGVVAGLLVLRVVICVFARLGMAFCEMDLDELDPRRPGDEAFNITPANILMSGIFNGDG